MIGTIKVIILVTILIAFYYFLTFRRIKKNETKDFDSVAEFHKNYIDRKSPLERRSDNITNYRTRYNSQEDYREK